MGQFANLRNHARKTFKFKQDKLMAKAVESDANLMALLQTGQKLGLSGAEVLKIVGDTGACGIFAAQWLAELLKGTTTLNDASLHTQIALTAMQRNMFLKKILKPEEINKWALKELFGLSVADKPMEISKMSNIIGDRRAHHYFIIANSGSSDSDVRHGSHAVAYSITRNGCFFDPNIGEYEDIERKGYLDAVDFFESWQEDYRNQELVFTDFQCYAVGAT